MAAAFLTAAVVLSLLWLALRAPAGAQVPVVEQGMGVLAGCLVGGRLGYVLVNLGYYQVHRAEIIQIWAGGLSGIGAALGGVLALVVVAGLARQKLGLLTDRMLPILIVLGAAGWLGCWWEGCAYGLSTDGAWWGLAARDEWGNITLRFPLQLVGVLLGVTIPWLVEAGLSHRYPRGAPAGWLGAFSLVGSALAWLGLSFLRGDPTPLWYGWRPESWGALTLLVISLFGLFFAVLTRFQKRQA